MSPSTAITTLSLSGVWSPQLRNRRTVDVYLPASYSDGRDRYPVLYMQDGQNLSDPATAFAGTWRLLEVLDELARDGSELIVVGVHHKGRDRIREYGPFPDRRFGPGKGDRYAKFLASTLKPQIDRRFRTSRARDATAILGSSMGGLISLYAFFEHPRVFGAAGAMSPALWYGERRIFDAIGDVRSGASRSARPQRIYIDMGTEEGSVALRDARAMADRFERAGYRAGQSLLWIEESGGRHTEQDWSRRLGRAIRFLLPATEAGSA
jgi:predicted alpha/beta superfamily hydrolase